MAADGTQLGLAHDAFVTQLLQFLDDGICGFSARKKAAGSLRPPFFMQFEPLRLGRGRNLVVVTLSAGLAGASARLWCLFFIVAIVPANGWRKHSKRDPLFAFRFRFLVAAGAVSAILTVSPIRPGGPLEAVAAAVAAGVLAHLGLAFLLVGSGFHRQLFVALILVVVTGTALSLLLFKARAAILQDAEIMIGVLEVIFGLDAVAGELGIAREALVFLHELGGIAALAVILTVATGVARHSLRTLSAAATTTAALTIIDQLVVSLSHWRRSHRPP